MFQPGLSPPDPPTALQKSKLLRGLNSANNIQSITHKVSEMKLDTVSVPVNSKFVPNNLESKTISAKLKDPILSDRHPFEDYYHDQQNVEQNSENPVKRLLLNTNLDDIQAFRNETIPCMKKPGRCHMRIPADSQRPPLSFFCGAKPSQPYALYVVAQGGTSLKCFSVFKELPADDRPDLFSADLSCFSYDILSERQAVVSDFLIGDLIIVFSLEVRYGVPPDSYLRDSTHVLKLESHKYWSIEKFAVVQRCVTQPEPFSVHQSHFKADKRLILVNNILTPLTVPTKLLGESCRGVVRAFLPQAARA